MTLAGGLTGASAHLLLVSLLTACVPGMLRRLSLSFLLPAAALPQLEDVHSMSAMQASKAKSRTTNAAVYCDRYHTCMTPWQAISRCTTLAFSHGSTARICMARNHLCLCYSCKLGYELHTHHVYAYSVRRSSATGLMPCGKCSYNVSSNGLDKDPATKQYRIPCHPKMPPGAHASPCAADCPACVLCLSLPLGPLLLATCHQLICSALLS